ncbi:unnamed protein product [Prunus armeniaca]|uniref:Aminotransferase-like plant mobile domain-containing protein n=1 Tax=Prunus armeniaca TaxID=36596 RepID=A0A6J5X5A8_PRUAR|nr:unnamed protein product [Prunus armeniaca]
MAPRKMKKNVVTKEEKLIERVPFLKGDGALLERQKNRARLETLAESTQGEVICWNFVTLLDRNMVLGPRYVTIKPVSNSSLESTQYRANILFRGPYTPCWENWDVNVKRLYPQSEPMRTGTAWRKWVTDMQSHFSSSWKDNGIYDAILLSLQDLKVESSLLASALMFWNSSSNTFDFGVGPMTPTLLDMAAIFGFRPHGRVPDCIGDYQRRPSQEEKLKTVCLTTNKEITDHSAFSKFIEYFRAKYRKDIEQEHMMFLLYWINRFIFPSASKCVRVEWRHLAEALHNHSDVATGQWALASIYRCLHDVTVDPVNMNINGPIWMVQMWLQWYFPKLRSPGVIFKENVVPAQTLIESALLEPTTAFCLVVFKHSTQQTENQWLANVRRKYPSFMNRLIYETPPQAGKAKEEFAAKAFACLLPRELPYGGSRDHQYVYGVEAYNPHSCGRQLGCQQVIPEYLYTGLNLESSFRPPNISMVDIAKTFGKMLRLVPTLEMVGYVPSCQCSDSFFVWERAEDLEAIVKRIESDNEHSRVEITQALRPEVASQVVMTQWGVKSLAVSEKKETTHSATAEDKEQMTKAVRDVGVVSDASPHRPEVAQTSLAAERASLLADPKIHELAEKPGGLPEVLQTVKEREAMRDVILETPALNIDASKAVPATAQPKSVQTYISKSKQTPTASAPSSMAKQTVLGERTAESTKPAIKSPMAQKFTDMEVKEREVMGIVIFETPALNIDASKAAPTTFQAKQTVFGERTAESTKPATKSLMAQKVSESQTTPPAATVSEIQTVPLPQKSAEITSCVDKGKNVVDQPKREFPDLASFLQTPVPIHHEVVTRSAGAGTGGLWAKSAELLIHVTPIPSSHPPHYSDLEMEMMVSSLGINPSVGYSSSAFDPMIEMVRSASAPAAEEKMADMEGSASSPMDIEIAPEPFGTRVPHAVPLNVHRAGEVIFLPDDEEEEMKNEEGAKSPGSAAKRSLQRLLELEDLPESSSVSIEVDVAKKVLATWASRPFDVAQSYVDMQPVYEILVKLMRAYPNL